MRKQINKAEFLEWAKQEIRNASEDVELMNNTSSGDIRYWEGIAHAGRKGEETIENLEWVIKELEKQ